MKNTKNIKYVILGIFMTTCLVISALLFANKPQSRSENSFLKKVAFAKNEQKIEFDRELNSLKQNRLELEKQIELRKYQYEQKKNQQKKDRKLLKMIAKVLDLQQQVSLQQDEMQQKYAQFLKQTNGQSYSDKKKRKFRRNKNKQINRT